MPLLTVTTQRCAEMETEVTSTVLLIALNANTPILQDSSRTLTLLSDPTTISGTKSVAYLAKCQNILHLNLYETSPCNKVMLGFLP